MARRANARRVDRRRLQLMEEHLRDRVTEFLEQEALAVFDGHIDMEFHLNEENIGQVPYRHDTAAQHVTDSDPVSPISHSSDTLSRCGQRDREGKPLNEWYTNSFTLGQVTSLLPRAEPTPADVNAEAIRTATTTLAEQRQGLAAFHSTYFSELNE
ncbi:hypothetical protein CLAFUW4_07709 [Fulvia fulva]|uniref:Uncharacterized protein n=1 Tax=Passalora fulva TaxID=5499 RepID=A0A9Q8LDS5_PASFU|nr:uncharacterized protein CLAFUR5_07837 [Fulvia fulva]KAK4629091.1 hypothetical protein CLAFUR4_07714 [Fulvia fulva]KAK4630731.1 hypothetical protein CLAFUR0_07712 [Fulvia fulva]UJO15551.1 hypothetical protein CLAFUR5_07837 [Fulvia fulva]WPV13088.1 hypothetical protein CLAFUW4_07709 [Fulvia fulva]WPV27796.1 hypothetical protein CLAFUW7_07710 [Fulvia fulva]